MRMMFNDIKEAVVYLYNSTIDKKIPYSCNLMVKTENFLTNFVHNPQVRNEEAFDFGDGTVFQTIREDVLEMDLFDFDQSIYCCVSFGNIDGDNLFKVDIDFNNICNSSISSDDEAFELLKEYYGNVTYEVSASRKDEIIKRFKGLTIII